MRIAVIITTYNRPDALRAVLDGYRDQTDREFELLVADDGSREATRDLVLSYNAQLRSPLAHVWQEDRGFRAAAIRNRAIAQTQAEYIVFTDGDCVPPRSFVRRHRMLAEPGYFVAGNRVLLSKTFTDYVIGQRVSIHAWSRVRWFSAWLRRDINRFSPLLRFSPNAIFRKASPQRWQGVKTCNLAVWRADLLGVNGLDEGYEGWGLEDSDLVIRLLHAGVRHKSGRIFIPVFHLWHAEYDRSHLTRNEERLHTLFAARQYRAAHGIDRYLKQASG